MWAKLFSIMWNPQAKRIPYGIQGFEMLRRDNCYYVDKTRFIQEIEYANKYFFLVRPRRFGKTLTMTMLETYYDINKKEKFEEIFSGLWIGENPTKDRNTYLILEFNFSLVNGGIEDYKNDFDEHCGQQMEFFVEKYADLLPLDSLAKVQKATNASKKLDALCECVAKSNQKIYLFIDEYDNFTNNILSDYTQLGRYMDETHRTGYLRTFFNALKDGSKGAIERLFITGVSPVTLDDLTSGFNIGTNYTTDARFNEITGFTEQETRKMLTYYSEYFKFPCSVDEIIETIRPWYDNYCFAEDCFGENSIFKPSEVLYFLCRFCNDNEFPDSMPDSMNIYSDFLTPKMLIRKDKDFKYEAAIVKQLLSVGHYNFVLKDDFPPENIANKDVFISLLFYYGLITICGQENGLTVFKITNRETEEQLRDFGDVQRF